MSWSAKYTVNPNAEQSEIVTEVHRSNLDSEEHQHQHDAALMAAVQALTTGAVGRPEKTYDVSISGHSNPDHEPAEGWANDFISIQVTQQ
jgi:hypothetical protein